MLLAVSSSLWWGELMALTRADVNLRARTVRVARSLSDDRGRIALGPPKSAAGKRTVAVPDPVVPVLREHLREFSEAGSGGRVFVGAKGATLRRSNFQTIWLRGVKMAGLSEGFRFHDLRHTGSTWAPTAGPTCASSWSGWGTAARGQRSSTCIRHAVRIVGSRTASAVNLLAARATTRATSLTTVTPRADQRGGDLARIWHGGRSGAQVPGLATLPPWALTWCGAGDEDRTRTVSLGS